jgi:hypothetical protein
MSSLRDLWHYPAEIRPSPNNSRFNSSQQAWAIHFDLTSPYSSRHRWMMPSSSPGPTNSDCCRAARVRRWRNKDRAARLRDTQPMGTVPSPTSSQPRLTTSSSSTTVLRFTLVEIAQRRKENKCFHCEELFTPGHKQHCKQLFVMEVIQEDDDGG